MNIFKYVLQDAVSDIVLPSEFVFLDAQFQNGNIVFWAAVEPLNPPCHVSVWYLLTGDKMDKDEDVHFYKKTIQIDGIVLHIFLKLEN